MEDNCFTSSSQIRPDTAYAFDYHLARTGRFETTQREKREKRENLNQEEYRFYRKRIYALTKWMVQQRHTDKYSREIPDGLSRTLPLSVRMAFDDLVMKMIDSMKIDDRNEAIQQAHRDDTEHISNHTHDHTHRNNFQDISLNMNMNMTALNQMLIPKQQTPIDKLLGIERTREKREKQNPDVSTEKQKSIYPTMKNIELNDEKYRVKRLPPKQKSRNILTSKHGKGKQENTQTHGETKKNNQETGQGQNNTKKQEDFSSSSSKS